MRSVWLAAAFALGPAITWAADFPAWYRVTNVAPDDVLNIRRAPEATADVMGGLPPDGQPVEVIALSATGTWAQVNDGETAGWVAARYLERLSPDRMGLPLPLECGGTEPFWSLRVEEGQAGLSVMGTEVAELTMGMPMASRNDTRRFALRGDDLTVLIARASCSDGMSDRAYGLTVDMLWQDAGVPSLFSGCCNLAGAQPD